MDEAGRVVPNPEGTTHRHGPDNRSKEDMLANSLMLLLSKLNSYLVTAEKLFSTALAFQTGAEEDLHQANHFGLSHISLLQRWDGIRQEVDTWYANLPETFKPVARISHPVFSEIWHSIPMCASAMQNWHMAKILLLINKPHETIALRATIASRLNNYQSIREEVQFHCREICGIALSRPEGSVRIFSIQPLFVAGSCLTEMGERKVVLELLENIERDLGWATQYRCEQLRKEWLWEE